MQMLKQTFKQRLRAWAIRKLDAVPREACRQALSVTPHRVLQDGERLISERVDGGPVLVSGDNVLIEGCLLLSEGPAPGVIVAPWARRTALLHNIFRQKD